MDRSYLELIAGCSVVSPGCTTCYAARRARRRLASIPKSRGVTLGRRAVPLGTGAPKRLEAAYFLREQGPL